jgi:flagellar biosynthesis/type III secretory pathway chaperone
MDAPIKVRNLIVIVEALIDVLARETNLLKSMRVKEIGQLQGDKQRLSYAYEENHRQLTKDPAPIQQMGAAERQGLGELLQVLQQIAAENTRAIEAAKSAGERVLRLIVESVKDQRTQKSGYTRTGTLGYSAVHQRTPAPAVSLAVNRNF